MDNDNPEEKRYLTELCTKTQGDIGHQVSMFDVGAAIGMEKADAGMMAEELIIQGLAELKSLSGGIGITIQGVEMVRGKTVAAPIPAGDALQLGSGTVLGEKGRQAVEKILGNIRTAVIQRNATFGQLEEIVITATKRSSRLQDTPISVTAFAWAPITTGRARASSNQASE